MDSIISSPQMRAIWKSLKDEAAAKGLSAPQPGFIRLEQYADASKSIYTFPVKEGSGMYPTEVRLNDNDALFAKYVRLRVKQEVIAKPGSAQYQSYANTSAIVPVASEVAQDDIDGLWNSLLNIIIDQKEVIKRVDMSNSRVVPITQQSSATNRSSNISYDGFIDLVNVVRLSGSGSININLLLTAYTRLVQNVAATGTKVIISLEFYGFLAPGGSALGNASINY